jgi:orotidine-5'-phosphate decarboxylase
VPGLGVDALTANPLPGRDALTPLIDGARRATAGVFVLVRTSNPGAADLMDLELASGEPLWERLAAMVDELGHTGRSGISDVGAVTGATAPQHLARMRELMPRTPFLLPGVGAQGGDVSALAPAFAPGRAAGLVTASRSIAHAHEDRASDPPDAARAEAERLRELAWALR